ncbi:MAG: hypothetical protein C5B48_08845 [Candidatus Rokuibacteriota bacterium]|nr:MAG: hypothetical protein C5B48_08845 [Candidatus Rokubacteria bacterium]
MGDWAGYAAGCTAVLAVVLLAGTAVRPRPIAVTAAGLLLGLAVWTAISIGWSPFPSLARDEALLVGFYAVAFLVPLLTLRAELDRLVGTALLAGALGALAVAGALELHYSSSPQDLYWQGRMAFPVSYPNALAALLLVGFWPAVGLAAEVRLSPVVRALVLGGAAGMLADLLLAQSKGGAVGLAASGIAFFAFCPARLRALVPAAIVAAVVGSQAVPLTDPYRVSAAHLSAAIQHGGAVAALTAAGAALLGLVYALVDRRVTVSARVRRVAAVAVAVVLVAAALASIGAFFGTVNRPESFVTRQWRSFKHLPGKREGSTHFFSLGSNRYDFWRVALHEFERHPVAGIGARGFGAAYLVQGRSSETPERAHSVELDELSETGIIGFLLLVAAGACALAAGWPWARRSVPGAGVLAAGVYFAVHSGVDWVWTIPEVGIPAFALLGIGASWSDHERLLPGRVAAPAGALALALALLVFTPPWLSSRLVDRAYGKGSAAGVAGDLRWARRLDPLATDPLVAQAELARPPGDIPPLERAVAKEPRREDLRYLLGTAYLAAGRKAAARRQLEKALALYPGSSLVQQALAKAR